MDKLLIVGIDPGTTVGYSVIDIWGNLVFVGSQKNFSLSSLIFEVIKHGKPVIVGCDVSNTPSFVKSFASKVGAVVVKPEEDMKIEEKRKLAQNYRYNNIHEMDSIAASVNAYNFVSNKIRTIEKRLISKGKMYLFYEICDLLLRDKKKTIEEALGSLEIEKVSKAKRIKNYSGEKLVKKINELEQENFELKKSLVFMKNVDKPDTVFENNLEKQIKRKLKFRERRAVGFSKALKKLETENEKLKEKISELQEFSICSKKCAIIRKLENLSGENFDDVVYVKDTNIFSLDSLDKNKIVIYEGKLNKKIKENFFCVHALDVKVDEFENLVKIDLEKLDEKIKSKEMFEKVLDEYKKSRKV